MKDSNLLSSLQNLPETLASTLPQIPSMKPVSLIPKPGKDTAATTTKENYKASISDELAILVNRTQTYKKDYPPWSS